MKTLRQYSLTCALVASLLTISVVRANAQGEAPTSPAVKMATILTNSALTREERLQARDKLMAMPSEEALLALVPALAGMWPQSETAQAGTALSDAELLATRWEIVSAVQTVWAFQDAKSPRPYASVSRALVAALPGATSQIAILNQLGWPRSEWRYWRPLQYVAAYSNRYWIPGAEKPVYALFRDPQTPTDVRLGALACLLEHTGKRYYPEAKQMARTWPQRSLDDLIAKSTLISLLLSPDWRRDNGLNKKEVDPDLMRLGFSLLPSFEKIKKGGGYLLAVTLGHCVGQDFTTLPEPTNFSPYQEDSRAARFFATTTAKALKWWQQHQKTKGNSPH